MTDEDRKRWDRFILLVATLLESQDHPVVRHTLLEMGSSWEDVKAFEQALLRVCEIVLQGTHGKAH